MSECYPPLTDAELESLPEPLQDQTRRDMRHVREVDPDRPCTWLDLETRRCVHHGTYQPAVCRGFECGGESCLAYVRDAETV